MLSCCHVLVAWSMMRTGPFALNALRSSGPQMRGVPRPGASENLESNLPDVENVPSDDEPSDIPAWGDLFPDEEEDLPDVSPKRPRSSVTSCSS